MVIRLFAFGLLLAGCASTVVAHQGNLLIATYGVEANGCSLISKDGSGVSLAPDLVMTSAHTVAGAVALTVYNPNGESQTAALVALDTNLDLAVLRIPAGGEHLQVRDSEVGDAGWLLSFSIEEGNNAKPITVTKRIVATIEDIYNQGEVERRAIEFEGDVVAGDSGGAVVGEDGQVIGIVYAASRERAVGFALRSEEIEAMLTTVSATPIDPGACVP